MKIVILDGYTANPGDLNWKKLEGFGDLYNYDRTPAEDIIKRCEGAEIVLTNKTPMIAETIAKLPALRYIGVLATGYNVVDVKAASQAGITVCNVPSYSTMSVAQNVWSLILEITNRVGYYTREVLDGKWCRSKDFCFIDTPLTELSGKTLGIIGLGAIGRAVAGIGLAFGMKVMAYTSKNQQEISPILKKDLKEIFSESDIISLHCPLTEETHQMVNAKSLELMKTGSILINTGRGQLIDENAVAGALKSGKLSAVGVDVLSEEPPHCDNPLLSAPNLYITPHISWATKEARDRLISITVQNVEAFLGGTPINRVN